MIPDFYPPDGRDYLREELSLRQARRPNYSLRAFARDLNMSPSSLCEFLTGRQGLSLGRVHHVAERLGMAPAQRDHFSDLVEAKFGRSPEIRRSAEVRAKRRAIDDSHRLSREKFYFVADWYHLTLLEILSLPRAKYSPDELAEILNISAAQVQLACERLQQLGLISPRSKSSASSFDVLDDVTLAGDNGPDEAIRQCHQQLLLMQARAVDRKNDQERESLAVSFKIAQKDWQEIRAEMKRAILSIASRYGLDNANNDQVIAMSMQMITLIPKTTDDNKESK
jgi:uncharacterized protein (TIGR02147 family)